MRTKCNIFLFLICKFEVKSYFDFVTHFHCYCEVSSLFFTIDSQVNVLHFKKDLKEHCIFPLFNVRLFLYSHHSISRHYFTAFLIMCHDNDVYSFEQYIVSCPVHILTFDRIIIYFILSIDLLLGCLCFLILLFLIICVFTILFYFLIFIFTFFHFPVFFSPSLPLMVEVKDPSVQRSSENPKWIKPLRWSRENDVFESRNTMACRIADEAVMIINQSI